MKFLYKNFTLLIGLLIASSLNAQDPVYSQFYSAPQKLNPAMTVVYDGSFRVGVNYRDQWASVLGVNPYRTYSASYDIRLNAFKRDYFGVGVNVLRDEAGEANYNQSQAHLSLAYMKQLSGGRSYRSSQYLVVGAQAGLGQNGVTWDNLRYGNQYDREDLEDGYDPNLPSNEARGESSQIYPDVNAGVMWYGVFDERRSVYAGIALNHVNGPDISFFDDRKETLYMRWVVHGGGEIPFGRNLSLLPGGALMVQGEARRADLGANFRYTNRDWNEIALRAGLWGRIVGKTGGGFGTDALVAVAALEMGRIQLGISYDVNTSTLVEVSNSRGAFEVSLIYIHPPKPRLGVECPNF